ncbi:ECF transporter S component [Lactobacillus mulieris]|uniref:ECF transporter S component n=1 Tax=Lactobacillus mulieris TaxID=2508708 RepID=UPI0022444610|nr:ECF transporter S component [Lactobacillus mulieris]MCW8073199.1 ECF transporter S component [Lactobacillus mulieris]MDK6268760.1 ECF transporter S component [Lactobacillus mulieris]
MTKSRSSLAKTWAAVMIGVIAFVVMKIEFPIIPIFPFLKMDFSDVIILIGSFLFGPISGIGMAFIKCFLSLALSGFNILSLVGQIAAFLASICYIVPLYMVSKKNEDKFIMQIAAVVVGTICLTLAMSLANIWLLMPMYAKFANFTFPPTYILYGVVPFNVVKGVINGILAIMVIKFVLPQLENFASKRF